MGPKYFFFGILAAAGAMALPFICFILGFVASIAFFFLVWGWDLGLQYLAFLARALQ